MIRKLITVLTAVCCLASSAVSANTGAGGASGGGGGGAFEGISKPAEHAGAETAKFYYTQEGDELKISVNGQVNKGSGAADAILAVYDGEILLKTIIFNIDEAADSLSVGDFTVRLPYAAENTKVKSFLWSADGKCKPMDNASELSNVPSGTDEWYGIVIQNSINSGLDKDEVQFLILSPNGSDNDRYSVKTGATDIENRLFELVKANVVYDEERDEYTIVGYETVEENQTVSFPASSLVSGADYESSRKLSFDVGNEIEDYEISEDAELYVNGVRIDRISNNNIEDYILNNQTGTVKLVDAPALDGSTDGTYDDIMVSYYRDAIVDCVQQTSSFSRIYFKDAEFRTSSMKWDPDDDNVNIKFTDTNGNRMSYTEICEYDVLSIGVDVMEWGNLDDLGYYDIKVSRNVLRGTAENIDTENGIVRIHENDYRVSDVLVDISDIRCDTEYTFFLDAFDCIARVEEGNITPPTPEPTDVPDSSSGEFVFNGVDSTLYIQSPDENNIMSGTLKINTAGEQKQLTAEINLIKDGRTVYTKYIQTPGYSAKLSYNNSALAYSGTPDSAVLCIKDNDTVLYTSEVPVTDAEEVYSVKGRVIETSRTNTSLENNQISYRVETADEFDGTVNINFGKECYTMGCGNTDAENMMFIYSEAKVAKEADGSYTILLIKQCGDNQTVTFPASMVTSDDPVIGWDYTGAGKLPVYKDETSLSTIRYSLCNLWDGRESQMYINGVCMGAVTNDLIEEYILNNTCGTVTLVDETYTSSISNDGRYDYIFVDYYTDVVVGSVSEDGDNVVISTIDGNSFQFNPSATNLRMKLNGESISPKELQKYDVLSIAADMTGGDGLNNLNYYDIIVSRNRVTGTVTSRDTSDNTIRINGTEYQVSDAYMVVSDFELATDYTVYINAFGVVVYADEKMAVKNYGVITAMYQQAGYDYPTVRLITADGETIAYECRTSSQADKFYNYATGTTTGYSYPGFTKENIKERIISGKTVCTYDVKNEKIVFDEECQGVGGTDMEYSCDNTMLGGYSIADTDVIAFDYDRYNGSTGALSVTPDLFDDGGLYHAYVYGDNGDGSCRFIMIFNGIWELKNTAEIAVVQKAIGMTDCNGVACTEIDVSISGDSGVSVLFDGDVKVAEGSVIVYKKGMDGYVCDGDWYTIMSPQPYYAWMFSDILQNSSFGAILNSEAVIKSDNGYIPTYGRSTHDVKFYFGIVYKNASITLELLTDQTDGVSNINNVEQFRRVTANEYLCDYGLKQKDRVSLGTMNQSSSIFISPCYADAGRNYVSWNAVIAEDVYPMLAFVKTVDGDVTDVVYYAAP